MKIIIIGAGFTGLQLAKRLVSEKMDVVLIDNDEETVRHASNSVDCLVIQANGNNLNTLEQAGISKADALIALTKSDEINMITCSLVDSVYPDIIKIARVRNYDYYSNSNAVSASNRHMYGIDYMIHPDVAAAEEIVTAYQHGAIADILEFDDSKYEMASVEIEKESCLDGIRLKDINSMSPTKVLIPLVTRDEKTFLPVGDTELKAGDTISILIEKEKLSAFLPLTGSNVHQIKRIALVGAGRIGTKIADCILKKEKEKSKSIIGKLFDKNTKNHPQLVIIDKDYNLAKEASETFEDAIVYNADITDESFIEEENLSRFDLVIAATHNHELNMVASAYFKTLGCKRSICLVTNSAYALIAKNIDIDVAVPIKDVVVDAILSHLRGKNVTGVHTLSEGEFEVVEFEIPPDSKIRGKALKDIRTSETSFIVLLVNKGDTYMMADGNTILETGDKLIFIVETKDNKQILSKLGG
ncbi:MAG: Trk system potassium transporter TrkA [Spirochaetaceae bacterium]|nr:Trk system potassium transporter TrkA [Spirochaetaceae bacterium]